MAEIFSIDAGPQFKSQQFKKFLADWGVEEHRVSSAYFPHSNLRAETAVKTAKRLIRDNTASDGTPNWDKVSRALMNHRNTPDTEWKLSPAQLIFGRPVRDFLPIKLNQYSPAECWITDRESRELAMKHRIHLGRERWTQKTKELPDIKVGQHVNIQNQRGSGKIAKRWDRTGVVVEDLGYQKYRVRIDGSGRTTDRNRQFLRIFKPATFTYSPGPVQSMHRRDEPTAAGHDDGLPVAVAHDDIPVAVAHSPVVAPHAPVAVPDAQIPIVDDRPDPQPIQPQARQTQPDVRVPIVDDSPVQVPQSPVRRSGRARQPNKMYGSDLYDLS